MMARFFFHVFNGHGDTPDEEGLDLADQASALQVALDSVRSMISEDARLGVIDLDGRIVITDQNSNKLVTVRFAEAFELRIPPANGGKR